MSIHVSDDELTLHYYGDDEDRQTATHLSSCSECQDRYRSLQRLLNSFSADPVPERSANYGDSVWRALQPAIASSGRSSRWRSFLADLLTPRHWVPVAGIAALVLAAFLVGRYSQIGQRVTTASAPGQVRDRVLLVAVGDHLERSQMVLAEIANANPDAEIDLTGEKLLAENLVDSNRLYRQTATVAGENAMAGVLDDLERVLLDVANGPDTVSGDELKALQNRIEGQGLLFKVRVIGTQIKERDDKPVQSGSTKL